jgi:hypothetical protein
VVSGDGLIVPHARREGLITREFGEETLIYDLRCDQAHCLNWVAALVWQHCDGKMSVAELAQLLKDRSIAGDQEAVVSGNRPVGLGCRQSTSGWVRRCGVDGG